MPSLRTWMPLLVGLTPIAAANCFSSAEHCEATSTCGASSARDAEESVGGRSGASSGPAGQAADAGHISAAGTSEAEGGDSFEGNAGASFGLPCGGTCTGATPVCNELTDRCVECTVREQCGGASPSCNPSTGTCVECVAKDDCADEEHRFCDVTTAHCAACLSSVDCQSAATAKCSAGACTACTDDADCIHVPGKGVCSAGACVQCTGDNFSACGASGATPLVCDSLAHRCSPNKQASSGPCQPCVSDAHCGPGQACVQDFFGVPAKAIGYFCHWIEGGPAGPAPCAADRRPYVAVVPGALSIDGERHDVCALSVSTCVARNEFRVKSCTVGTQPSDLSCGMDAPKDAKCVNFGASASRCTMTCASSADCPPPFSCNLGVTPAVCNLN